MKNDTVSIELIKEEKFNVERQCFGTNVKQCLRCIWPCEWRHRRSNNSSLPLIIPLVPIEDADSLPLVPFKCNPSPLKSIPLPPFVHPPYQWSQSAPKAAWPRPRSRRRRIPPGGRPPPAWDGGRAPRGAAPTPRAGRSGPTDALLGLGSSCPGEEEIKYDSSFFMVFSGFGKDIITLLNQKCFIQI